MVRKIKAYNHCLEKEYHGKWVLWGSWILVKIRAKCSVSELLRVVFYSTDFQT
jgi:hypothetical protein